MDANGREFVEHWDWAAEKGLMNKNTAAGLRAACTQVLGVLDDWEGADIANLDVEETIARFQNLRKKDFAPKTLEEYKRRFRKAVTSYLAYLADPGAWKPVMRERTTRGVENNQVQSPSKPKKTSDGVRTASQAAIEYPFPLRENQTVRLILPRDLHAAEVKRLAAFMMTLAVDSDAQS